MSFDPTFRIDNRRLQLPPASLASTGNVLRCLCHGSTAQQISSNVAHWCYLGYRPAGEVIKTVAFAVSTAGAGTQAAEVCIATSATGPTGSGITVTKLWADGTVDSVLSTGVKGNTTPNTVPLANDSHVWAGIRIAMTGEGSSNPTLHVLQRDWGRGVLAWTTSAGVLTSGSSWTATPVTFANNTSTDIRGYL